MADLVEVMRLAQKSHEASEHLRLLLRDGTRSAELENRFRRESRRAHEEYTAAWGTLSVEDRKRMGMWTLPRMRHQ